MQQIRYFLALAETLNFTRAAEDCNVSQPALTRAIQALEGELGGDLVRREGRHSHLTELGKRMLPLLQRCYESALTARELARAVTKNEVAPLAIAVSNTVNLELFMPLVSELFRTFPGLQLRLQHGPALTLLSELKSGNYDLAIASSVEDGWERLDRWPLFAEGFEVALPASHPLALRNTLSLSDLSGAALLKQTGCEDRPAVERWFSEHGGALTASHEYDSHHDLKALLQASAAVALVPVSAPQFTEIKRVRLEGLEVTRTVHLYAVAGRLRSAAAAAFLNLVRSTDFSAAA
jgi:DNA-binding transcriptional LysR family regulator